MSCAATGPSPTSRPRCTRPTGSSRRWSGPRVAEWPGSSGRSTGRPTVMSRISPRAPRGPFLRATYAESKRQYGKVPEPVAIKGHTPLLLAGYGAFEMATQRSRRAPVHLKELAELKVAALVGCEWCLDLGAMIAARSGMPAEQVRDLNRHRESEHFDERERLVLDYAEAMTRTPVEVGDELVTALREFLDDAQLVELTSVIALENYRARFNWAMGIGAQGFADGAACPVPAFA